MSIFVSLLVCGATGLYLTEGPRLVSLDKPISINSEEPRFPVANAVDGKSGAIHTCNCCAATTYIATESWYLLDLQQPYGIVRIEVLGRTDFDNFLNHMEISVGNTEGSLTSLVTTDSTPIREYNYTLSPVRSARYVKLTRQVSDYFVVCELSVYAVCADQWYGPNCGTECGQCVGVCDKGNGDCPADGCAAGYQGDKCDQECGHGRFGPNCNESCGNCFNGDVCSKIDGACPHLCAAGYMGVTCHSPCSQGKYGQNCLYDCGNCYNKTPCMADTGLYEDGCAEGFSLPLCAGSEVEQEHAASSVVALPVFVGVVGVLGLLVILSVVVNIVLIRRTSTLQKEQYTDQPETTSRHDTPLDISSQYGNNPTQPDPGQYEMLSGDRVQRAVPHLDYEALNPDDVIYEN